MRPLMLQRLFAVALATLPLSAAADTNAYAVGFNELYRIELGSARATRVGPIGFNDVEGLAVAPDGTLFGVADATMAIGNNSSATTDFLIRINPTSGAGTLVGQLPGLQQPAPNDQLDYGLAFTCDGRLWMSSDSTGQLWEVNPASAAVRLVGNLAAPISGLAANGQGLYGVSTEPGGALYSINTETAAVERLGSMQLSDRMYDAGADFDADGRLWVTVDYLLPPTGVPVLRNDLAELDPRTGARYSLTPITGAGSGIDTVQMEGMAIRPTALCGSSQPGLSGPRPVPFGGQGLSLLIAGLLLVLGGLQLRRTG